MNPVSFQRPFGASEAAHSNFTQENYVKKERKIVFKGGDA